MCSLWTTRSSHTSTMTSDGPGGTSWGSASGGGKVAADKVVLEKGSVIETGSSFSTRRTVASAIFAFLI